VTEDLTRFLERKPILARPVGQMERLRRWCLRNPLVASLAAAVFGLLVTLAVVFGISNMRLSAALDKSSKAERESRLREADALVGEAFGTRIGRRDGQRIAALAALKKAADIGHDLGQPPEWFDRLRNEAIAALALPDMYVADQWKIPGDDTIDWAVSEDHSVIARATTSGAVWLHRRGEDTPFASIPANKDTANVQLNRDGTFLAVVRGRNKKNLGEIWNVRTSPPTRIASCANAYGSAFSSLPDGDTLIFVGGDGSLTCYQLPDGKRIGAYPPEKIKREARIEPHPHAPVVVVCSYYHKEVEIRDFRTGKILAQEIAPWPSSRATWHPQGDLFICKSDFTGLRIYRFDPKTARLDFLRSIDDCGHGDTILAFNAKGDRFFATGWNSNVTMWDLNTGQYLFQSSTPTITSTFPIKYNSRSEKLALAGQPERPGHLGIWSIADGREYRPIVPASTAKNATAGSFAIDPDERIAVQIWSDGLRVFDLMNGSELAKVSHPGGQDNPNGWVVFDDHGSLYWNEYGGFFRWPLKKNKGEWTFGPPTRLPFHPGRHPIAASPDGSVVVQSMDIVSRMGPYSGGWILHPMAPKPRRVDPGMRYAGANISPDGKWAAFTIHEGVTKIFETETAKLVWASPLENGIARFSRDGKWFMNGRKSGVLYEVGTWQPKINLGPGQLIDLTFDNTLALLCVPSAGTYRLVDATTGKELARLEDPHRENGEASFSRDGTKIFAPSKNGIRVWDLRRIRTELSAIGLDWHSPAFPAASPGNADPIRVNFAATP
jgi:WD40 repeat protein